MLGSSVARPHALHRTGQVLGPAHEREAAPIQQAPPILERLDSSDVAAVVRPRLARLEHAVEDVEDHQHEDGVLLHEGDDGIERHFPTNKRG